MTEKRKEPSEQEEASPKKLKIFIDLTKIADLKTGFEENPRKQINGTYQSSGGDHHPVTELVKYLLTIRDRLLAGLDQEYNVVNMEVVIDVLSQLESILITKEALEVSRLGKHINKLRRKSSDPNLAKRAKALIKKWRQLLVSGPVSGGDHHHLVSGNSNIQTPSEHSSHLTSPLSETPNWNNVWLTPGLCQACGRLPTLLLSTSTSPGFPVLKPITSSNYQMCNDSLTSDNNAKYGNVNNHRSKAELDKGSVPTTHRIPATPFLSKTQSAHRKNWTSREKAKVQDSLMQKKKLSKQEVPQKKQFIDLTKNASFEENPRKQINVMDSAPGGDHHTIVSSNSQTPSKPSSHLTSPLSETPNCNNVRPSPGLCQECGRPETVEDILDHVPPIDSAAVLVKMEAEIVNKNHIEVDGLVAAGPTVLDELHEGQKECFNGNFDHEGNFHEWFEGVSKWTKDDDLLYILPYCVIE